MSPPPCHGGIRQALDAPKERRCPWAAHLVPLNARKSQADLLHIEQIWPALWAASTQRDQARWRAFEHSSSTGLIVPRVLEMWVRASSLTSEVSHSSSGKDPAARSQRVTGRKASLAAGARRQKLPGHDIAVVLHLGEQNDGRRPAGVLPPGVGHQVMPSVVPRVKMILGRVPGVKEAGGPLARGFVGGGGPGAQFVGSAMHVGVACLVIMAQRFDHHPGFLRGRRISR